MSKTYLGWLLAIIFAFILGFVLYNGSIAMENYNTNLVQTNREITQLEYKLYDLQNEIANLRAYLEYRLANQERTP